MDDTNINSQKTTKRLGRGLSSLLGESGLQSFSQTENNKNPYSNVGNVISILPLKYLKSGKYQPRTIFVEEDLKGLAESNI